MVRLVAPDVLARSRPHLRAASFAAVAVPVTSVAHLAGGGHVATPLPLVLAASLAYGVHRFAVGGRDRSGAALLVALLSVQGATHLLLSVDGLGGGHAHQHANSHSGPAMLLCHLLAATTLGVLLQRNEAALWVAARRGVWAAAFVTLWRRTAASMRCRLAPQAPADCTHRLDALRLALHEHLAVRRLRREWTGGRVRRGPPACLA